MITNTEIKGLKVIQLTLHKDSRGFFTELFNKKIFSDLGLPIEYAQDNYSFSFPGVVRGLHYQTKPAQSKLITCIGGAIWDVSVDIRKNSPTFGKYFGCELSSENRKSIFIPDGFAHGFCAIGNEPAQVLYKVSNNYNKSSEGGILYNDKNLNIEWPVKNPIISEKDLQLESFTKYAENPLF
jgi:dTDP-4-dehydrorhamnose 3,5-epimerase